MKCSECGGVDAEQYTYPDGTEAWLCEDCAAGMFCIGCGCFIGGTESIFIYGRYECGNCRENWQEEDEYDDFDYEDEPN